MTVPVAQNGGILFFVLPCFLIAPKWRDFCQDFSPCLFLWMHSRQMGGLVA
jgi:hypothetical protein